MTRNKTNVSKKEHMNQKKNDLRLEIILALLKREQHLRELAKTIKEPLSNTRRAMLWLYRGQIVDYKKEGKNKTYYLTINIMSQSYVFMAEHYKLFKFIIKNPEMQAIIEDIINVVKGGLAVLFGSFAKGTAENDSDIDVYVETEDREVKREIEKINSRINVKIGKFDIRNPLIREIIKEHIIIKGVEAFYERNKIFG